MKRKWRRSFLITDSVGPEEESNLFFPGTQSIDRGNGKLRVDSIKYRKCRFCAGKVWFETSKHLASISHWSIKITTMVGFQYPSSFSLHHTIKTTPPVNYLLLDGSVGPRLDYHNYK